MPAKLLIAVMVGLGLAAGAETTYRVWPSQPPSDCPFEFSHSIVGIAFTGRHIRYANADTWYPSWASYILESDHITGPWKLAVYMRHFGEQGYFVNIPSKFIGKDGRSAWLCYAANFTNGYLHTNYRDDPPGGGYGMTLQEIRLLGPSDKANRGQALKARPLSIVVNVR